jgi:ABC-type Mn2+/Zn2+ transport system ATPase subunit
LLSLVDDDSDDPMNKESWADQAGVSFGVSLSSLRVSLSDDSNVDNLRTAQFNDFEQTDLLSPCLIVGENGHGKSLLAKALADAIPHEGRARITGRQNDRVRLVFQDVSNQALLTAASLDWSLQNDPAAVRIKDRLVRDVARRQANLDNALSNRTSLLNTKISLVALRLAEKPAGLVLDEPDWGLTRAQATA